MATPELLDGLVDKGVAEDARQLAKGLERATSIPPGMESRLRAMARELADAQTEALHAGLAAELGVRLSAPLSQLLHVLLSDGIHGLGNRDRARLALVGIAEAFDEYRNGSGLWAEKSAPDLVNWLLAHVAAKQEDVAQWIGVSQRTLQRWKAGASEAGHEEEDRLRSLVRLVAQLQYSYTPSGIAQWLTRPIAAIGERTALDVLNEPQTLERVEGIARKIRGV
jgi:uncharacterized protein (DUF2384 family)